MHHDFKRITEVDLLNTCSVSTSLVFFPPHPLPSRTSVTMFTPTFPLSLLLSVPSARAKNIIFFQSVIFWLYAGITDARSGASRAGHIIRSHINRCAVQDTRRKHDLIRPDEADLSQGAQTAESFVSPRNSIGAHARSIQLEKLHGCAQCVRGCSHNNQRGNRK